jgi:hypothetical protein
MSLMDTIYALVGDQNHTLQAAVEAKDLDVELEHLQDQT